MIEIANILIIIDNLSFFEKIFGVLFYLQQKKKKMQKKNAFFNIFVWIFVYQIHFFYLCDYLF